MLIMTEEIENKFGAISAFASTAWACMVAALETLEEQEPALAGKLGEVVDLYVAKREQNAA
jgi:hypothetical protein